MNVQLDTHTLLGATLSPPLLSSQARAIIGNPANLILVSVASAWEIATKVRLGKLPGAEELEKRFLDVMEYAGYTLVPIAVAVALRAGRFTNEHRDPFDRVLAAQALADDIPILSSDRVFDGFGIRRIW